MGVNISVAEADLPELCWVDIKIIMHRCSAVSRLNLLEFDNQTLDVVRKIFYNMKIEELWVAQMTCTKSGFLNLILIHYTL